MPGPADLDDLIAGCLSEAPRDQYREAVSAYRAGAYRASIVSTWVAVVYDIIDKLKALSLTGDSNAKQKLTAFEVAHQSGDYKQANALEDQVIEWARTEFEFLTPLEAVDIERIHQDRHRCAHPALVAQNEPYRPTAELARAHLRSAAIHLLHRQPVQGKSALDGLFADVESKLFPTDPARAEIHLRTATPLPNARTPLVRNFVIGLATDLVIQSRADDLRARQVAALRAAVEVRREVAEAALLEKLPAIVGKTADADWGRLLTLTQDFPFLWTALSEGDRIKAEAFVSSGDPISKAVELELVEDELLYIQKDDPDRPRLEARRDELLAQEANDPDLFASGPDLLFASVFDIDGLRDVVQDRLIDLDPLVLADQIARAPHAGFVPHVLTLLADTRDWREGEFLVEEVLLPLADYLTEETAERAVRAIASNRYVYDAGDVRDNLADLYETLPHSDSIAKSWATVGVRLAEATTYRSRTHTAAKHLADKMRERFPDASSVIDEKLAKESEKDAQNVATGLPPPPPES